MTTSTSTRRVEDYYLAKASLFTPERARTALINIDDEHGRRLAQETELPVQTFSTQGGAADWSVSDVRLGASRSDFVVHGPLGGVVVPTGCPLPGEVNVANALAALAACADAGLDVEAVAAGIASSAASPGRFERIEEGQDFTVDRRLRPQAGRRGRRAPHPPPADRGRADHRARRRRGPGPGQAPDHGRDRGRAGRRAHRDRRQPAQRGPGPDPPGDHAGRQGGARQADHGDRGPRARRSPWRSGSPAPATSC